jgi:hypothetical protein
VQGEAKGPGRDQQLVFLRASEWGGHVAAMVSEARTGLHAASNTRAAKYLLMFDL